jgi:hypothetical protein
MIFAQPKPSRNPTKTKLRRASEAEDLSKIERSPPGFIPDTGRMSFHAGPIEIWLKSCTRRYGSAPDEKVGRL